MHLKARQHRLETALALVARRSSTLPRRQQCHSKIVDLAVVKEIGHAAGSSQRRSPRGLVAAHGRNHLLAAKARQSAKPLPVVLVQLSELPLPVQYLNELWKSPSIRASAISRKLREVAQ